MAFQIVKFYDIVQGLPQSILDEHIPVDQSKDALNNLLGSMRIKVFTNAKDGILTYQEASQEQTTK
jgi:hypothetical protein